MEVMVLGALGCMNNADFEKTMERHPAHSLHLIQTLLVKNQTPVVGVIFLTMKIQREH